MMTVPSAWIAMNSEDLISETTMDAHVIAVKRGSVIEHDYEKGNIKLLQINQHGNIVSGALTSAEAQFTVANKINGIEVVTADEIPELTGQQLYLTYGFGLFLNVNDYRFFVSSIDIDVVNETVKYIAKDVISFMTSTYTGLNHGTAAEIIDAVFEQAKADTAVPKNEFILDGLRWEYDSIANDITIYISADYTYTMAEVLQLIANACQCVLYVDWNGVVQIKKVDTDAIENYAISRTMQYTKPIMTAEPAISSVVSRCIGGVYWIRDINSRGQVETVSNAIAVYTDENGQAIAEWVADSIAYHPNTISVEFRADPRLELFDVIQLETQDEIRAVVVTDLELTYNGAWRGKCVVRDFGAVSVDYGEQQIDIYNTMMEYLASVENGTGDYQTYTENYNLFRQYLETNGKLITTISGEPLITRNNEYITFETEV